MDLVDWPRIFPKLWGILGWNVYVYHTHLDVTPPAAQPPARPVAWHQDSMRVNDEIECHPRPRLSLKVGYYLTDVSGPDWGNTLLLPGSHLQDELDCPDDGAALRAALLTLLGSADLADKGWVTSQYDSIVRGRFLGRISSRYACASRSTVASRALTRASAFACAGSSPAATRPASWRAI